MKSSSETKVASCLSDEVEKLLSVHESITKELSVVSSKRVKLTKFIGTSEFEELIPDMRGLLSQQRYGMSIYQNCLIQRVQIIEKQLRDLGFDTNSEVVK